MLQKKGRKKTEISKKGTKKIRKYKIEEGEKNENKYGKGTKKIRFLLFLTLEKTDVYCGQSIWKWCIIMRCVVSHTCVKSQKGCWQISSGNSGSGSSDDGRCGGCVLLTLNVIFSSANHDAVFAVVH